MRWLWYVKEGPLCWIESFETINYAMFFLLFLSTTTAQWGPKPHYKLNYLPFSIIDHQIRNKIQSFRQSNPRRCSEMMQLWVRWWFDKRRSASPLLLWRRWFQRQTKLISPLLTGQGLLWTFLQIYLVFWVIRIWVSLGFAL